MPLAKVIKAGRTVNNLPRQVGDIVEVCDNTLRNLIAKEVLEPAPEGAEPTELPEAPAPPPAPKAKKAK